jgi:hypothetical protein
MSASIALDDTAFERNLARQYSNATWAQLFFVYIGGPTVMAISLFMPFGTVIFAITAMLVVAGAIASVMRAVWTPKTLKSQSSGVERLVQIGMGMVPVLTIGLPTALYALYLLVAGALVSSGVL